MRPTSIDSTDRLSALRDAVADAPVLEPLDPAAYARGHAAFEARSDQRALIVDRLAGEMHAVAPGPISVLAIGCGDGALDAAVAQRLLAGNPDRVVRYVGVEPFAQSAELFRERMATIAHPLLSVDVHVSTFADAVLQETFDVVTFVHSMYYVPDVVDAARSSVALLRPGGAVLVLSAPTAALNQVVALLAPPVEGHRQWFSEDVREGLHRSGHAVEDRRPIEAVVDLTDVDDDVLDFAVQARLTPELRPLVRDYYAEVSLIEELSMIPHPVDVFRLTKDAA